MFRIKNSSLLMITDGAESNYIDVNTDHHKHPAASKQSQDSHEIDLSRYYPGLLGVRPLLDKYVKAILQSFDNNISNPVIILQNLFSLFIASFHETTFWNKKYLLLVKNLNFSLNQQSQNEAVLINTLKMLDQTHEEFKKEDEFIELWNAFFSFYPLYLIYIANQKLLAALLIRDQEESYFSSILMKISSKLMRKSRKGLDNHEMELLRITGHLGKCIEQWIANLHSEDCITSTHAEGSLVKSVSHVSREQMKYVICPVLFQQAFDTSSFCGFRLSREHAYDILLREIELTSSSDLFMLENNILPVFLQPDLPGREKRYAYKALGKAAKWIDKTRVKLEFLPLLLAGTKHSFLSARQVSYEALGELIAILDVETVRAQILPCFLAGINNTDDDVISGSIFKIFMQMAALPQLTTVRNVMKCAIRDRAEVVIAQHQERNCFSRLVLLFQVVAQDQKERICSLLLAGIENPLMRIRQSVYYALDKMPESEHTRLSEERTLLNALLNQIESEDKALLSLAYAAIAKFLSYAHENVLYNKIFPLLLNIFEPSLKMTGTENDILKTLAEAIKIAAPAYVKDKILPKIIDFIDFDRFQSIKEAQLAWNEVLKLLDITLLANEIFPQLLKKEGFGSENSIPSIKKLVPLLSYSDRVFYSRQLIRSFASKSDYKNENAYILGQLYLYNRVECSVAQQRIDCDRVTHDFKHVMQASH